MRDSRDITGYRADQYGKEDGGGLHKDADCELSPPLSLTLAVKDLPLHERYQLMQQQERVVDAEAGRLLSRASRLCNTEEGLEPGFLIAITIFAAL